MEPHNTQPSTSQQQQQRPILSSNFATTFPAQFAAGLNAAAAAASNGTPNNVSSPLFMSTLQQLSGLSASAAAAGFLPNANPQFGQIGNQFSSTNWNSQWLDQAKMAAMLPMYLQSAVTGRGNPVDQSAVTNAQQFTSNNNAVTTMAEQYFKSTAAAIMSNAYDSFECKSGGGTAPLSLGNGSRAISMVGSPAAPSNIYPRSTSQPKSRPQQSHSRKSTTTYQHPPALSAAQSPMIYDDGNNVYRGNASSSNVPMTTFCPAKFSSNNLVPQVEQRKSPEVKQQQTVYSNKMNKSVYYQQPNHSELTAIYHQQPPPSLVNPVISCRAPDDIVDTPAQSASCTIKPRQAGAVYGGRPPAQSQTENQYPQINVQQHHHQHQTSMNSGQNPSFYSADATMSNINTANVNRSRPPYVDSGLGRTVHLSTSSVHSSTADGYSTAAPSANRARPPYVDHNPRDVHHQGSSTSVGQLVSQQMPPPPSLHSHNILSSGEDPIGETSVDDLSVLELHDFGEFLIDKDAVSAALGVDTAALFGEGSVGSVDSDEEGINLNNVSSNNSSGPVGGASDRVVHDRSPSTNTAPTTSVNDQRKASSFSSNSTSLGNSAPLITSARMRELIHERRFEELANADKEVDRLVSLVARKDGRFSAASLSGGSDRAVRSTATPKSGGLTSNFPLFNFDLLASFKNQHLSTFNDNTVFDAPLNVVQFTPPDSPTEPEPLTPILALNDPSTSQQSKTITSLVNTSVAENKSSNNCKEQSSPAKKLISGGTSKTESQPLTFIPKAGDDLAGTSASLRMTSRASTSSITCHRPSSGVRQSVLAKSNRIPIYKQRSGATASGFLAPSRFLPPPNDLSSKLRNDESGAASRPVFGRSSIFGFGQGKDTVSARRSSADVDAYSFTDDEEDNEEESAMLKAVAAVKSQKVQKDQKAASNNTVYIPGIGYTTPEGHTNTAEILKHVVPKKRLSAVSALERPSPTSAKGDTASTPSTSGGQQTEAKPTLVEMIHRRRANAMRFLRTEPLSNDGGAEDDAFGPFRTECRRSSEFSIRSTSNVTTRHGDGGVTCMIKMENPILEADFAPADKEEIAQKTRSLPKLVIKFLKTEPESVETPQPIINESENDRHEKKKKKKHKKRDRDTDWSESNAEPGSDAGENGSVGSGRRKHKRHKKHHKKHHRHRSTSRHRDSLADITDTSSTADANNFSAFTFGGLIRTETQKTLEDDESSFAATGGKRRRMTAESAWSSGNHSDEVGGGSSGDDHQESMGRRAAELEFVNLRLASFSRADPSLPKGTFMVLKEEVFKAECPLWKIDNQNLLQKYPPIQRPDGGGTSPIWYRNSSTYSGWCEKMAADYLVVNIRFVKQSRAENIIEPLVPVADLFPAVAVDLPSNGGDYALGMPEEEDNGADIGSDGSSVNDGSTGSRLFGSASNSKVGLREHLKTLVQAMLHHAITFNFIATVKSSNDWNYLCAFNEIDRQNNDALMKLRSRVKWPNGCAFEKALKTYSNYHSEQLKSNALDQCQACDSGEPSMFVQFFTSEECTDSELLAEPSANNRENLEENGFSVGGLRDTAAEEAVDFSVCIGCERLAALYHKVHFMKYHIFKECEIKLENTAPSIQSENVKPEAIVGQCIGKKGWLKNIINDYTEVWRRC